jgi:ComF family protein
LARLAGVALDTLLPPQCPACGEVVEDAGTLCGPCWRRVDFLGDPQCSACGLPFEFDPGPVNGPVNGPGDAPGDGILCGACIRARPPYARARSVMVYGDFSRRIVLAFKHGDRTDTAPALGRWLVRAGAELIRDADLIAPVPLHWTRLFARRYNQAALLAGVVGGLSGVAVVQDLLVRRRRTPVQVRMGWAARRRNVRGAFKVHPARRDGLQGRRVLLIDDVLTTGATASACAGVLMRGGAGAVDVLTLARVVRAAY